MILTLRDIKYLKENGYKGSYLDVNDHLSKMPYGGEVSGGDEDPLLKKMLEKNTVVAESTLSRPTTQQQKVQETQIKRELDFQNPNLSETEFRERNAGVSRHRYQYDSNPEYKARVTQQADQLAKTQGSVDYPNTSFLSKNYSGNPNLVFATPNQQDNPEALKSVEQFNMDLIASVLPLPELKLINKIPRNLWKSKEEFESLYHYSNNAKLSLKDIDVFREASSQMKSKHKALPLENRFGGFYTTKNAESKFMGGNNLYELRFPKDSKILDLASKRRITDRIPIKELKNYKDEGYDIIKGKNMLGLEEWILLNKDKINSFNKSKIQPRWE